MLEILKELRGEYNRARRAVGFSGSTAIGDALDIVIARHEKASTGQTMAWHGGLGIPPDQKPVADTGVFNEALYDDVPTSPRCKQLLANLYEAMMRAVYSRPPTDYETSFARDNLAKYINEMQTERDTARKATESVRQQLEASLNDCQSLREKNAQLRAETDSAGREILRLLDIVDRYRRGAL
jgi:pyruvoyl-dependent arginine decarboxylase (PvlArgDC)